jgi:uncharacterized coiled-coil DUF342 family protein
VSAVADSIRTSNSALLYGQTTSLLNPDVSDELSETILSLSSMLNSVRKDLSKDLKSLIIKSSPSLASAVNP